MEPSWSSITTLCRLHSSSELSTGAPVRLRPERDVGGAVPTSSSTPETRVLTLGHHLWLSVDSLRGPQFPQRVPYLPRRTPSPVPFCRHVFTDTRRPPFLDRVSHPLSRDPTPVSETVPGPCPFPRRASVTGPCKRRDGKGSTLRTWNSSPT